jgi:hypothetical protein
MKNLPNAIALNSSMVNYARIVGQAMAGIILVKFGAMAQTTICLTIVQVQKTPPCLSWICRVQSFITWMITGHYTLHFALDLGVRWSGCSGEGWSKSAFFPGKPGFEAFLLSLYK